MLSDNCNRLLTEMLDLFLVVPDQMLIGTPPLCRMVNDSKGNPRRHIDRYESSVNRRLSGNMKIEYTRRQRASMSHPARQYSSKKVFAMR